MWEQAFTSQLLSANKRERESAISTAHARLVSANYTLVGFHGTSLANARNMVPDGLDPSRQGSGAGLARGPGLYVAGAYSLAKDYADESTQDGDPDIRTGAVPRKAGDAGQQMVLRVYACFFENMGIMSHYAWGLQSSSGDPNNDKKLSTPTAGTRRADRHDMEIVLRTSAYPMLAVIPASENDEDGRFRPSWKAHDDTAYLAVPAAKRLTSKDGYAEW